MFVCELIEIIGGLVGGIVGEKLDATRFHKDQPRLNAISFWFLMKSLS
jgi:hypothetical protein